MLAAGLRHRRIAVEVTPEFEAIVISDWRCYASMGGPHEVTWGGDCWIATGRRQFFIEFVMMGGVIRSDYDTREKWDSILSQLHSIFLTGKPR